MRSSNYKSVSGNFDELSFINGTPDEAGDLLGAGISRPFRINDWWEMRGLWSYPYYTLNLMLEGSAGTYRNESGFQCELSYGDFFLTFPGIKQHYGAGKKQCWHEYYVSFSGEIFDCYRNQKILPSANPVWRLTAPAPWIERLQQLLQEPRPESKRMVAHYTLRFLTYLLEMIEAAEPVQPANADGDWFHQACLLLAGDLHHKVDLQQIAATLGMSYHTFRLYFTRRAGISPARYRDELRLKTACELLRNNPHKSCKQIAFNLGYCNGDYFSAYFKRHTGLSPHQYRKQHRAS